VAIWSKEAMPTKLGQFEILSELAKSPTGSVYKANDPETGQTVALKAIQLSAFGEHASELEQALLGEIEKVKSLGSENLSVVKTANIIEGQFCAPMEYVQGNSIATMLARKEGFSIWDLLDIGRQLCNGLDSASPHDVVHYSLEPSKIMCGWDGTVKILGYGISGAGNFVQHVTGGASSSIYYMSPEQVRGEATDIRSNLFSLGAIFYEMVTEKRAFDGADVDSIRESILENTPIAPIQISAKIHPLLSDLIVKALSKDPAKRYQSGRALLDDLENCRETRPATKKTVPAKSATVAPESKFVASVPAPERPHNSAAVAPRTQTVSAANPPAPAESKPSTLAKTSRVPAPKTAAAAAAASGASQSPTPHASAHSEISLDEAHHHSYMSTAASDEPAVETFEPPSSAPRIAVDPLMAASGPATSARNSFSEISELPPLKEVYVAPEPQPDMPPPQPPKFASSSSRGGQRVADKPKIQPREAAAKAVKEIKAVPAKLMLYALVGAGILILVIALGVTYYIHSQSEDETSRPARNAAVQPAPTSQPAQLAPQPDPASTTQASPDAQPAEIPDETAAGVAESASPSKPRGSRSAGRKKAAVPVLAPGQLSIDSTPQGAHVELDGATDASWVTPLVLTNIQPGKHAIAVTKPGYGSDTRSIEVGSGAKATTIVHLSQITATLIVKSDPAGANIYVDSKDVGTKTPAQVSLGKGQHIVLVRKEGYLDETMNAQFILGQTFNFSPTLRALGNLDSMKTVGKMSKLFGKKGQADQGTISIHTQPKGAQVAINQHMLDKSAPVDVMLDPGNYVIDVTASGYAPIHKIVTVERGSKVIVDDVMQPQ
jgi:serine/threonine protein kinase